MIAEAQAIRFNRTRHNVLHTAAQQPYFSQMEPSPGLQPLTDGYHLARGPSLPSTSPMSAWQLTDGNRSSARSSTSISHEAMRAKRPTADLSLSNGARKHVPRPQYTTTNQRLQSSFVRAGLLQAPKTWATKREPARPGHVSKEQISHTLSHTTCQRPNHTETSLVRDFTASKQATSTLNREKRRSVFTVPPYASGRSCLGSHIPAPQKRLEAARWFGYTLQTAELTQWANQRLGPNSYQYAALLEKSMASRRTRTDLKADL